MRLSPRKERTLTYLTVVHAWQHGLQTKPGVRKHHSIVHSGNSGNIKADLSVSNQFLLPFNTIQSLIIFAEAIHNERFQVTGVKPSMHNPLARLFGCCKTPVMLDLAITYTCSLWTSKTISNSSPRHVWPWFLTYLICVGLTRWEHLFVIMMVGMEWTLVILSPSHHAVHACLVQLQ